MKYKKIETIEDLIGRVLEGEQIFTSTGIGVPIHTNTRLHVIKAVFSQGAYIKVEPRKFEVCVWTDTSQPVQYTLTECDQLVTEGKAEWIEVEEVLE